MVGVCAVHGEGAVIYTHTAAAPRCVAVSRGCAANGAACHGKGTPASQMHTTANGSCAIATDGAASHGEGASCDTHTAAVVACGIAADGATAHGEGSPALTRDIDTATVVGCGIADDGATVHGEGGARATDRHTAAVVCMTAGDVATNDGGIHAACGLGCRDGIGIAFVIPRAIAGGHIVWGSAIGQGEVCATAEGNDREVAACIGCNAMVV